MLLSSKRNQWGSHLRSLTLEPTGNLLSYHFFPSGAWKVTLASDCPLTPMLVTRKLRPQWALRSPIITGLIVIIRGKSFNMFQHIGTSSGCLLLWSLIWRPSIDRKPWPTDAHVSWKSLLRRKLSCYSVKRSRNISGYSWVTAPVLTRRTQGHHTYIQDHT